MLQDRCPWDLACNETQDVVHAINDVTMVWRQESDYMSLLYWWQLNVAHFFYFDGERL